MILYDFFHGVLTVQKIVWRFPLTTSRFREEYFKVEKYWSKKYRTVLFVLKIPFVVSETALERKRGKLMATHRNNGNESQRAQSPKNSSSDLMVQCLFDKSICALIWLCNGLELVLWGRLHFSASDEQQRHWKHLTKKFGRAYLLWVNRSKLFFSDNQD